MNGTGKSSVRISTWRQPASSRKTGHFTYLKGSPHMLKLCSIQNHVECITNIDLVPLRLQSIVSTFIAGLFS